MLSHSPSLTHPYAHHLSLSNMLTHPHSPIFFLTFHTHDQRSKVKVQKSKTRCQRSESEIGDHSFTQMLTYLSHTHQNTHSSFTLTSHTCMLIHPSPTHALLLLLTHPSRTHLCGHHLSHSYAHKHLTSICCYTPFTHPYTHSAFTHSFTVHGCT